MDRVVIRELVGTDVDLRSEMRLLGVSADGMEIMLPKADWRVLKVTGVPLRAALILKQEMLAKGGEAALPMAASNLKADPVDLILFGSRRTFARVEDVLKRQPYGLKGLADQLHAFFCGRKADTLKCGRYSFELGRRTLVMGILNVTPDSFSDGGRFGDVEAAFAQARKMAANGADIIDVGGESTRPGAGEVSEQEEIDRVLPVIERIVKEIDIPVSIDTMKARVAGEAVKAGAVMINDVSGLSADPGMRDTAVALGVKVVIMHMRGTPRTMQEHTEYQDLIGEITGELLKRVEAAKEAGIDDDRIILDPGIGFSKTAEQNIEIIRRLKEFRSLGYPILLGTSRKSFIGQVLGLPVEERVEGTAATVALGIANGADIVRVHDVKEMSRVVKMADAIARHS